MLSSTRPVLIDKFLEDAIEVDVDALRDKTGKVFIGGIMEHVEQAGVHSGDSACAIPPQTLSLEVINLIKRYTRMMADSLDILGLINIQYAVKNGEVFVLEANPRASRTVPFVSKATGVPLAKIAARVMLGATFEQLAQEKMLPFVWDKDLDESGYEPKAGKYVCVKEAVLPFRRFPEMDSLLGPEMRSTGEVMGIDLNFGVGFAKSQMASGNSLPSSGIVVMSLADRDKQPSLEVAKGLLSLGFSLAATSGTAEFFNNNGVTVETYLSKIGDTNSDMVDTVDLIASSKVTLVINTPRGRGPHADGAHIRSVAGLNKVPCLTTIAAAKAAVDGIRKLREGPLNVKSIQEYYLDYNAST
jgi:carbamoyl-phosphate synthase large subunit